MRKNSRRWRGWTESHIPADRLTEAWKKVVFNDFHDLGPDRVSASSTKMRNATMTRCAGRPMRSPATRWPRFAAHVNTAAAGGTALFVFNPLAWQRSGLTMLDVQMPGATQGAVSVLDPQGHVVPSEVLASDATTNTYHLLVDAKNVPSMGYTILARGCLAQSLRRPI